MRVNKITLAARIVTATGLSRADVLRVLTALFGAQGIITTALRSGDRVSIRGFGTFAVSDGSRVTFRPSRSIATKEPARGGAESNPAQPKQRRRPARRPTAAAGNRERNRHADDLLLGGEAPPDVQFTVCHPRALKPDDWYPVLVYVHTPGAADEVAKNSGARLESKSPRFARGHGAATTVIRRNEAILIVPELAGCRFNPQHATITWLKDWHRIEFEVRAERGTPGFVDDSAVDGRVAFYVGAVLVGEVRIGGHISKRAEAPQTDADAEMASAGGYRKIFVSYSHRDATVVAALESAYHALGDIYMRDVRVLRAGESWNPALLSYIERADIFQLCWSYHAQRSESVQREWQHALAQRRPYPFVRPTYWEEPMPEPPPELEKLHFAQLPLVGSAARSQATRRSWIPGFLARRVGR